MASVKLSGTAPIGDDVQDGLKYEADDSCPMQTVDRQEIANQLETIKRGENRDQQEITDGREDQMQRPNQLQDDVKRPHQRQEDFIAPVPIGQSEAPAPSRSEHLS